MCTVSGRAVSDTNCISICNYNIFSADEILGATVWGQPTSRTAGEDGHKIYTGKTHMQTKETTSDDQYKAVTAHQI
jgi:hypothetical protein